MTRFALLLLVLLPGCPGPDMLVTPADSGPIQGDASPQPDSGVDAYMAPERDSGVDAPRQDSGIDGGSDAGSDASLPVLDGGAPALDRTEVDWGMWRWFTDAGAPDGLGGVAEAPGTGLGCTSDLGGAYPVTCVSWESASAFCAWHGGGRLPTRAEWLEDAARFPIDSHENVGSTSPQQTALFCGGLLCDAHGNVAEWVSDEAPSGGHIAMGAAFDDTAPALSERASTDPDVHIGFRCRTP